MSILSEHFNFVNDQITFHLGRMEQFSDSSYRKSKHAETASMFRDLLDVMKKADELLETSERAIRDKRPKQLRLSLTPDDIDGLPDDLIDELSISGSDKVEFAILNVLEESGGIASLDQIIVGLYRQTEEIHKRTAITNRLYRMVQKGIVFSAQGKKGVYSLRQLTENDLNELLGESSPASKLLEKINEAS
jgi:uncharacterized protein (DUF2384 family)